MRAANKLSNRPAEPQSSQNGIEAASRRHVPEWWSVSEVVGWVKAGNPAANRDHILRTLHEHCEHGRIRSQWKAKGPPERSFAACNSFEAVPAHAWVGIGFSQQLDRVYSASLPRMTTVEVRFRRADVHLEMRKLATAISKPSRLGPHWGDARIEAFRRLRENPYPRRGDGGQSKLEGHMRRWLDDRGYHVAESTIRKHVRQWMDEFEQSLD